MRRTSILKGLLALAATALLAACASSHVLTGNPRPPIDPSQVRIYYGPPPGGYEEIARLEVSSGAFTYGDQNKTNAVIERLRKQAAGLGANGVLFQGTADGYGGGGVSVGGGAGRYGGRTHTGLGVGVNISPQQKHANGIAIYVPNPPPEAATAPPVD